MRTRAAIAVVALLLVSSAHAQPPPCPTSGYVAGGGFGFIEWSTEAPVWTAFGLTVNHVAGTLQGGITGAGEAGASVQFGSTDRYSLIGPSSATPISFNARLRVTGIAGSDFVDPPSGSPGCLGSNMNVLLSSGGELVDVSAAGNACNPQAIDTILEIALAKLPGEEFTVYTNAAMSALHQIQASVSGTLYFINLPPGYTIQSCKGYAAAPVAAKARSWGQVKKIYR